MKRSQEDLLSKPKTFVAYVHTPSGETRRERGHTPHTAKDLAEKHDAPAFELRRRETVPVKDHSGRTVAEKRIPERRCYVRRTGGAYDRVPPKRMEEALAGFVASSMIATREGV